MPLYILPASPAKSHKRTGADKAKTQASAGLWRRAGLFLRKKVDFALLLALALPLLAVMPLLTHAGLPNTADGPAHLMRQVELNEAWQEGNFYPRWGADLALGHGMPIFSYAPPALYQLTQLFHLSGLPLDKSMKAVLVFDFLLYSLGMFLLARRLFGPGPALVAAALYIYAPYRLREAYIQGNYGQFTGLAFYPLILWAFHGLITEGRSRYLVLAALSLAGLLFSHNISFMLFAPLLAVYLLFLLLFSTSAKKSQRAGPAQTTLSIRAFAISLGRVIAAGLLGLGLAAIFWLPAFGERHDIKLEGITQGFFDFRHNFISLSEFISPPLRLDLTAINPEFPLSLGLPQVMGAGAGLVVLLGLLGRSLWRHKRLEEGPNQTKSKLALPADAHTFPAASLPTALFFAFFFLLYTFLALPQSAPVWEAVPLLELAEFPWRMLGPAILCAGLLTAFALAMINKQLVSHKSSFSRYYYGLLLAVILATIALNAPYLYPSQFIEWGTPGPADAFAYEVASGAIGTTSTGEFLPRGARQHPAPDTLWPDYAAGRPPQKIDPDSLPEQATVEITADRAELDAMLIDTPRAFTATVRTLYWPGWQVTLDGQAFPFIVTGETGLIQTPIPPGRHTLTLELTSTPLRTTGLWLTLLSVLTLAAIAVVSLLPLKIRQPSYSTSQRSNVQTFKRSNAPISPRFFALTTAFLIAVYLLSRPLAPLFVLQSDPDQPLPAGRVLQVDFGRAPSGGNNVSSEDDPLDPAGVPLIRLVGMDPLPDVVEIDPAGRTELEATLFWRALQPLQTNYTVFLHLDAPNGQTMATVDEVHPENIPTRNWPPGLYLRNPLALPIPADLPPNSLRGECGYL